MRTHLAWEILALIIIIPARVCACVGLLVVGHSGQVEVRGHAEVAGGGVDPE